MNITKGIVGWSLLTGLCFHVDHLRAQETLGDRYKHADRYAQTITEEELKEHLEILAGDAYEGRETGKAGQKKAAQYLADYYKELGIRPVVNGSYFQQYPLKQEVFVKSTASLSGKTYKFIDDFYCWGADWRELDASDMVFVGYGIDDPGYTDYKDVNVNDKVVLCFTGEPTDANGKSLITGSEATSDWAQDYGLKQQTAAKKGAKAIVVINPEYQTIINRIRYWLENAGMTLDYPVQIAAKEIPLVYVSPAFANDLLATKHKTLAKLKAQIDKKQKSKSLNIRSDLKFTMVSEVERFTAENVLGFIEGSDPILKNEVVVISAHYDHIGIVKGEINNGADDDGSGTVTTLEIAEAFVKAKNEGFGPRRSILILNVSGEEKGLLGSEWYSEYPVFSRESTVCDLNIDMIGRKDDAHSDGNYVYLIGSDKLSTDLHKISEECNRAHTQLALDYTYNDPEDPNRFYYRSDHYNFARFDIPVIFYFSGVHEDYHKPGDDVEKIMFGKMQTIGRLIFYTAWEVANREERLKVDVVNDFGDKQ